MKRIFRKVDAGLEYAYEWSVFNIATLSAEAKRIPVGSSRHQEIEFYTHIALINLAKLTLIIAGAYWGGFLGPLCWIMLAIIPLRTAGHGFHMKTNLGCTIVALLIYWGGVRIGLSLPATNFSSSMVITICTAISFAINFKYAPAQSKYAISSVKAHLRRICSFSLVLLIGNLALRCARNDMLVEANLLSIGLLLQSICILPVVINWFERDAEPEADTAYKFKYQFKAPSLNSRTLATIMACVGGFLIAIGQISALPSWEPIFPKMPPIPESIRKKVEQEQKDQHH